MFSGGDQKEKLGKNGLTDISSAQKVYVTNG